MLGVLDGHFDLPSEGVVPGNVFRPLSFQAILKKGENALKEGSLITSAKKTKKAK